MRLATRWGSYSAPPDPLAVIRGGKGRQGKGREGQRKGRKGRGRGGERKGKGDGKGHSNPPPKSLATDLLYSNEFHSHHLYKVN